METDRFYLELALQEAEQAGQKGTYPIGALIVGSNGNILSKGRNRVYSSGDYTAHAEIDALRSAGDLLMLQHIVENDYSPSAINQSSFMSRIVP